MEHFTAGLISIGKWNVLCIPSKPKESETVWEFYLNRDKETHLMFMFGIVCETEKEAEQIIQDAIWDYTEMYWEEILTLESE